jgi:hypothetical protein
MLEQTDAPTQKRQAALPIGETSTTIIGCEVLPLLSRPAEECELGWVIGLSCILCATLVLMPIGRTLESCSTASQTYLATSLSEETQSWPGEPNIGGGSPTLKDPFASWPSRAVLEQFPTPRTILVHLPQHLHRKQSWSTRSDGLVLSSSIRDYCMRKLEISR